MPGTGPKVGRGLREYRGTESKVDGCDHSGTRASPLLPSAVTRSVTSEEFSIAAESRDANLVLWKVPRRAAASFRLCPLIADSTVSDLIVPWKRLENGLGSVTMLSSGGDPRSVIRI